MLILEQKIEKYLGTNLKQPYQAWSEAQSYPRNTMVLYKNYLYRNIVHNNKGVEPDLNSGKWLLMGVDNAYAGIDLHSHSETVIDEGLDYIDLIFATVEYDYIGFGNVKGKLLQITEYNSSGVKIKNKDVVIGADRKCADSWYNYFFCAIPSDADLGRGQAIDYLYGTISHQASKVRVRLHKNADGVASLGTMVSGKSKDIGKTQFGVSQELIDYSEKTTDKNGIISIVKRDAVERMTSVIEVSANNTQAVKREIKKILGKVVMVIAEPEKDSAYDNLIILGYIEDFNIAIHNRVMSIANMTTVEVI